MTYDGNPGESQAKRRSAKEAAATRSKGTKVCESVRIKLCGMFRAADIEAANTAAPDCCGFVVNFPKSHRSITPAQLAELVEMLDPGIKTAGVFVDQDVRDVAQIANDAMFDFVQLHGSENARYIEDLRMLTDTKVVQAFKVRSAADLTAAAASSADLVLLDNGYGTGDTFDWDLLDPAGKAAIGRPFALAGGLTPENIPEAIARFSPCAVDISSGIETDGLKDPAKMLAAVRAARA